jgi:hypothetical protein
MQRSIMITSQRLDDEQHRVINWHQTWRIRVVNQFQFYGAYINPPKERAREFPRPVLISISSNTADETPSCAQALHMAYGVGTIISR